MIKYGLILALLSAQVMGTEVRKQHSASASNHIVEIWPVHLSDGNYYLGLVDGPRYLTSLSTPLESNQTVSDGVNAYLREHHGALKTHLEPLFHFESLTEDGNGKSKRITIDHYVAFTKKELPGLVYLEVHNAPAFYPKFHEGENFKRLHPDYSQRILTTQRFIGDVKPLLVDIVESLKGDFDALTGEYGPPDKTTGRVTISPETFRQYSVNRARRAGDVAGSHLFS